jgi:hypothetical protein
MKMQGLRIDAPPLVPRQGRLLLTAACVSLVVAGMAPQDVRVVNANAMCRSCRILLEPVAVLGDRSGPGLLSDQAFVSASPDGSWLVSGPGIEPSLIVFDQRGAYARTVGRGGSGPGEFQAPFAHSWSPGDTLYVFDKPRGRVLMFSADFSHIRTYTAAAVMAMFEAKAIGNGRVILTADSRTQEAVGLPLHLLDTHLNSMRSFGSTVRTIDPRRPYQVRRVLGGSPHSSTWMCG